jgi:hypothetical protein
VEGRVLNAKIYDSKPAALVVFGTLKCITSKPGVWIIITKVLDVRTFLLLSGCICLHNTRQQLKNFSQFCLLATASVHPGQRCTGCTRNTTKLNSHTPLYGAFLLSVSSPLHMSRGVRIDARFPYQKNAFFGAAIKETIMRYTALSDQSIWRRRFGFHLCLAP